MKRSIQSLSLVSSLLVAMSSSVFAEGPVAEKTAPQASETVVHTALPEGATFPQNVIRAKVATYTNMGKYKSYDQDGKSSNLNLDHSHFVSALVLEYGILSNVTTQVAVPFVLQNKIKNSDGSTTKLGTGLGDIEAGALYNFLKTDSLLLSTGLGVRFASGRFADASLTEMTGKGSYDLGLRLNADYQVVKGLWLSAQEQAEYSLSSVEYTKVGKGVYFDKKGLSHKAFAQANFGFGVLNDSLKALSAKARYAYNREAEVQLRSSKQVSSPASSLHRVGGGLGIDGTAYGVPVAFDALYLTPVAGSKATSTPSVEMNLSTYIQI